MLVQRTCSHEEAVASESTLTTAIPTVSASATLKDFATGGALLSGWWRPMEVQAIVSLTMLRLTVAVARSLEPTAPGPSMRSTEIMVCYAWQYCQTAFQLLLTATVGAVYLYRLSAPANTPFGEEGPQWQIDNKLFASDGAVNDRFGWAVAVSQSDDGDGTVTVIVGARGDDNAGSNSGSAYVLDVSPNANAAAPPPPPATVHPLPTDCDKCSSFADFYRCTVPSERSLPPHSLCRQAVLSAVREG